MSNSSKRAASSYVHLLSKLSHPALASRSRRCFRAMPHSRLVWTNEEGDNGKTVTTVTFDENAGKTLLVVHDRYPSKEALDSGSTDAMPEALDQLDELLASLGSTTETK